MRGSTLPEVRQRRPNPVTYANVMSTAAAALALVTAATSKPVRKSVKRLRKRLRRRSEG